MNGPTIVILNPIAGGGAAARRWPQLRQTLVDVVGDFSLAQTEHPGHATALARAALSGPYRRIICIGGDGTLNEVVNGFFEGGTPVCEDAVLAPISCGTGGDFRRSLPDASVGARAGHLACKRTMRVDVGRLRYRAHDGSRTTRHFINIASFGMGGVVDQAVHTLKLKSWLSGKAAYLYAILKTLARYRNRPVELHADGTFRGCYTIRNVAVANGQFFGGGLAIAPDADLRDGQFDVVILGALSRTDFVRYAPCFYRGTHAALDGVEIFRAQSVTARPLGAAHVLLDVDGEPLGRLPATFDLLPNALTIQY